VLFRVVKARADLMLIPPTTLKMPAVTAEIATVAMNSPVFQGWPKKRQSAA